MTTGDHTSAPLASVTTTPSEGSGTAALNTITQLCRSSNLARRHLERSVLRDARLTWTSYDILQLTISRQPIDTRTIADVACISKATVTICANDLVTRGLIRRGFDAEDNRRVLLHPTAAAWQLVQDTRALLIAEIQQLLHHHIPGLNTDATALLRQIAGNAEPPRQSGPGDPPAPIADASKEGNS